MVYNSFHDGVEDMQTLGSYVSRVASLHGSFVSKGAEQVVLDGVDTLSRSNLYLNSPVPTTRNLSVTKMVSIMCGAQ